MLILTLTTILIVLCSIAYSQNQDQIQYEWYTNGEIWSFWYLHGTFPLQFHQQRNGHLSSLRSHHQLHRCEIIGRIGGAANRPIPHLDAVPAMDDDYNFVWVNEKLPPRLRKSPTRGLRPGDQKHSRGHSGSRNFLYSRTHLDCHGPRDQQGWVSLVLRERAFCEPSRRDSALLQHLPGDPQPRWLLL